MHVHLKLNVGPAWLEHSVTTAGGASIVINCGCFELRQCGEWGWIPHTFVATRLQTGTNTWTDSWAKRDKLDITSFIIYLFNAQHVSDVNTSILRGLRLICWVISWVVLLWFDVCWCYVVVWLWWCGIRMQAKALQCYRFWYGPSFILSSFFPLNHALNQFNYIYIYMSHSPVHVGTYSVTVSEEQNFPLRYFTYPQVWLLRSPHPEIWLRVIWLLCTCIPKENAKCISRVGTYF